MPTGLDLEAMRTSAVATGFAEATARPDDNRRLDALRLAASTGGAAWSLARACGTALALPVAGRLVELTGNSTPRSVRRWLEDFWLALLVDDVYALAALCYTPPALRGTDATAPYLDRLADAVREYWLHDTTASSTLLAALRASDPAQLGRADADRALDLDVPLIETLFALLEMNAAKLDHALGRAFARCADNTAQAWPALPLAAVLAQAHRIGLAVTTTSPRAPASLLHAGPAERELLLCPYCLAPLLEGMHVCPACLEDPTHDAWIESDVEAFHASPRSRCTKCSTMIARLAVRCPSCRNPPR